MAPAMSPALLLHELSHCTGDSLLLPCGPDNFARFIGAGFDTCDYSTIDSLAGAIASDCLTDGLPPIMRIMVGPKRRNQHDVDLLRQYISEPDLDWGLAHEAIMRGVQRAKRLHEMAKQREWLAPWLAAVKSLDEDAGVFVPADLSAPGKPIKLKAWCTLHRLPPPELWLHRSDA